MKTQYAGFWKRLLAFCTDQLILVSILIPISVLAGTSSIAKVFTAQTYADIQAASSNSIESVMFFAAAFFYYFLFLTFKNGQTPGRMLLAIRVTKSNGKPVGPVDVIVRFISSLLSAFVFFLGFLWVAWDGKKQGWHDKIASTIVVKTDKKGNVALGVVITIIYFVIILSVYSVAFTKGVMIGIKENTGTSGVSKMSKIENQEALQLYTQALENHQQMLSLKPTGKDDPKYQQMLDMNDQTIILLRKAVEIESNNADIWNLLGSVYTYKSNTQVTPDEIINAYKNAYNLDNENPLIARNLGSSYLDFKGDANNAVIYLERSVSLKPESNPRAYESLAQAYSALGLKEESKKNATIAIEQYSLINQDGSYGAVILELRKLESGEYNYRLN